jgi:hypothetical protein
MTRADIIADLAAIERRLADRVELRRVLIDGDGVIRKRIYSGSFTAPPDWQPPSLEDLIARAKGRNNDHD